MTVTVVHTALSVVFLMVWAFIAQIVVSRNPGTSYPATHQSSNPAAPVRPTGSP